MIIVDVEFDHERSSEKFSKYFVFERNKHLSIHHLLILLLFGLTLIFIGELFKLEFLTSLGIFSALVSFGIFMYYFIKYSKMSRRQSNYLRILDLASERNFKFKFDENIIAYEAPNSYREINWNLIKELEENEDDLYM